MLMRYICLKLHFVFQFIDKYPCLDGIYKDFHIVTIIILPFLDTEDFKYAET